MAAPTNPANVKKALANPEPSKHGTNRHGAMSGLSPLLDEIGSETDIPRSVNRAVDGAINAVRLSSASQAERAVHNVRTTVRRPLTDAAVSIGVRRNRRLAHVRSTIFGGGKYRCVE